MTWATALTSSGGSLAKLGAGTLILTASNTYTGGTTVAPARFWPPTAANLPGYSTSGSVSVAGGATLAVPTNSNGTTGWSSGQIDSLTANATWTSGAAALGIDTTQGDFTYGGGITQPLTLTKLGPNTLTLTGSNTYSGGTTVSAGTLQLGDWNRRPRRLAQPATSSTTPRWFTT